MSERYPDDATLLALTQDEQTGVEYIPTGCSPYYLEFRQLLHRLLLATARANDLRVYPEDDLALGVRAGRCVINGSVVACSGSSGIAVSNNTTTYVYLASDGTVATGASLPTDRTSFVPLARVTAEAGVMTELLDLRSEAFLAIASLAGLGISATAAQINQALAAIGDDVTSTALNTMAAGPQSTADTYHRHLQVYLDEADEVGLSLVNDSDDSASNIRLMFSTGRLAGPTYLLPDPTTGWLQQRYDGQALALVGGLPVQFSHAGQFTASATGQLMGAVPVDGFISDVVLSVGQNIVSDVSSDGISAVVKVNGTAATSTHPAITDAAGSGFRSTAQSEGTAAVVKSDGTEQVTKGDVLTVDLVRTATGTITTELADVVMLVIISAQQPR